MRRTLRYAWAGPNSCIGLVLAALVVPTGRLRVVDGVLEAHGPLLGWLLARLPLGPRGVAAITFGHVVLGQSAHLLEATRLHERAHVAQYERWGAFFLPAYLGSSLWALLSGRHPYLDNRFELEARLAEARDKGGGQLPRGQVAQAKKTPDPCPGLSGTIER